MPTYDYQCEKCSAKFELFQSMRDAALDVCPKEKCQKKRWGKGRVRRLIGTGAGLIFKGSGFYITDYRSENYKAGAKKDAPPSAEKPSGGTKDSGAKDGGSKKTGDTSKPASKPSS